MKKVMLFTIALLFSMGANAANISITNAGGLSNATFIGSSSNNAPLAVYTWKASNSASTSTNTDLEILNNVTTDANTLVTVTWGFSPSALSGNVNQFDLSGSTSDSLSDVSGLSSYSFVMNMLAANTYYLDFRGSAVIGTDISLSVQEIEAVQAVPIPTALWLFAPALMGLLGLRRKSSSKDLVVA